MALADAYSTAVEYRNIIAKTDSGDDTDILNDLKAVSRYLDKQLGRFFTKDDSAVARIYRVPAARSAPPYGWAESENPYRWGGWARVLQVDDLSATPTSILIDEDDDGLFTDETALASTDYVLLPLNADKGPEPAPFTAIEIPTWSTKSGWPAGKRVQVTAVWGWPSVPEAIKRATVHLTAILRLETPRATQRVTELGETIGASREAREIIRELVKNYQSGQSLI